MAYFGDPYSGQQYANDILLGGIFGGISGGIANKIKGAKTEIHTNIWTDKTLRDGQSIWSLRGGSGGHGGLGGDIISEFPDFVEPNGKIHKGGTYVNNNSSTNFSVLHNENGLLGGSFNYTNGHSVDFLANRTVVGSRLELTDMIFYPKGVNGNELKNAFGTRNMIETLDLFKSYAQNQGFTELRMQFQRAANSSSANPGHVFDKIFKLR